MNKKRKVEKYTKNGWKKIQFKNLKIGDKFRLFDNENLVVDKITKCREWIANTLPYINKNGIREIKCDYA